MRYFFLVDIPLTPHAIVVTFDSTRSGTACSHPCRLHVYRNVALILHVSMCVFEHAGSRSKIDRNRWHPTP